VTNKNQRERKLYDITIYYIDPGIYLPVLCIDKTGEILIGKLSMVTCESNISH